MSINGFRPCIDGKTFFELLFIKVKNINATLIFDPFRIFLKKIERY